MLRKALMGAALALSPLGFGSGTGAVAQTIPEMTVVIYNNSASYNIYPVFSFPGQTPDEWLQGFFKVSTADIGTKTYPSAGTTRMYVNCCKSGEDGIPPGGSIRIKLPLYSPLVTTIDPTKPNQLIEWWQGGNINLYQSPKAKGPPDALVNLWNDATKKNINFAGGPPRCVGEATCHIFSVGTGNPVPADPQQLVEFTLGAAPVNPKRGQAGEPNFLFDPENVDYDVSYVNTAYLPVVMEPFGNNLVGWVGAPDSVAKFNSAVKDFLASDLAKGWPLFLDGAGKIVPGKVPSALEIFASSVDGDPNSPSDGDWVQPPKFKPNPKNSAPIQAMIDRWKTCQNGSTAPICPLLNDATKLLRKNFDNYLANFNDNDKTGWGCKQNKQPHPKGPLTDLQLLQHLYGWQPFNEHCAADANLLQHTPGYKNPAKEQNYQKVKNGFDHLQYWRDVTEGKYGVFHPYVALIHGPDYLNAPFTYAYSVDDAVGNVQTDGKGLIIAVGGTANLPNPDHATPNVNFNYAYKSLSNGNFFTQFGRCKPQPNTDTNPNFSSFAVPVGVTKKVSDCLITFLDNLGREYKLQISGEYPPEKWVWDHEGIAEDLKARLPVKDSCKMNANLTIRNDWCKYIFAFRKRLDDARSTVEYHVQIREPPPAQP